MKMTRAQFEATPEFKAYETIYAKWERNEATLQDILGAYDKLVALSE